MAARARNRPEVHGWVDTVATFWVGFPLGIPLGMLLVSVFYLATRSSGSAMVGAEYLEREHALFAIVLLGGPGGGVLGGLLLLWASRCRPGRRRVLRRGSVRAEEERVG